MRKYLEIDFCDSCYNHRITDGYNFCEACNMEINELGQIVQIPEWCPLKDAPNHQINAD